MQNAAVERKKELIKVATKKSAVSSTKIDKNQQWNGGKQNWNR